MVNPTEEEDTLLTPTPTPSSLELELHITVSFDTWSSVTFFSLRTEVSKASELLFSWIECPLLSHHTFKTKESKLEIEFELIKEDDDDVDDNWSVPSLRVIRNPECLRIN
ncbi:hypothetical protein FRX31_010949 [Thalictrum thalictroides]|uniref:Uncharacterized protein n=1 Tax=Thalictrum thalictroides TaxID=46969 RepID=A0A7J6WQ18_THATH|nr:hypothetical protein FRX31_010949 [Thalictrum thalictroides]